jgi:HD superfamily phosphodiesterase
MASDVTQTVADYVKQTLGKESYQFICAVVANCKMLALELDGEDAGQLDRDALVMAAYLHNISTVEYGYQDHHIKSAEIAVNFLRELDVPADRIEKVEQAILIHTSMVPPERRESGPLEGRVLFDADKLGRLSGLAVVTSLIEFGARYPDRAVTGEVLAAILRHIEERFVELYQSLHTAPARDMARIKFNNTLAFLDGVIEHLSDATPV